MDEQIMRTKRRNGLSKQLSLQSMIAERQGGLSRAEVAPVLLRFRAFGGGRVGNGGTRSVDRRRCTLVIRQAGQAEPRYSRRGYRAQRDESTS